MDRFRGVRVVIVALLPALECADEIAARQTMALPLELSVEIVEQ
jgi:hypothetical protein